MMRIHDHNGEIVIEFESDDGYSRGKVILRESIYGIEIVCPEVDPNHEIALLDMWSMNRSIGVDPVVNWDERVLQIILYSPKQTEDPVVHAEFYRGQTVTSFESGVESKLDPHRNDGRFPIRLCDKVFGYFDEETTVP